MQVFVAEPCGFCYGVKRAVDMARGECGKETHAATLGPLIHNPQLTAELAAGGVSCCDSLDSFEKGDTVIFRSHGVGPEVYAAAEEKGLNIIDATCPHVRAAQLKAKKLSDEGYFVIIIGEKNHPEVKSISAWAGKNAIIVEYNKDIAGIPVADKYGVTIQTTFELAKFEELLAGIQKERPGEYKIEKTICTATSERQNAAGELAGKVDAFIVIGGKNSANTRHLYDIVSARCKIAYHIETAAELKP